MSNQLSPINNLVYSIKFGSTQEKREAAYVLGEYDTSEAREALINALSERDSIVKIEAIKSLVILREFKAKVNIIRLLKDKNEGVRLAALDALNILGERSDLSVVTPLLNDRNTKIVACAIEVIGNIGSSELIYDILKPLKESEQTEEVTKALIRTFAKHKFLEEVLLYASNINDSVRSLTLKLLGSWDKEPRINEYILKGVEDKSNLVRLEAAGILQNLNKTDRQEMLSRLSVDDDPLVRRQVAEKLSEFKEVNILLKLLHDKDPRVRRSAAQSLGKIQSKDSIDPLISSIKVEDVISTKFDMVTALGEITSEKSLLFLELLSEDNESGIRIAALRGISKINSEIAKDIALRIIQNDKDDWARGQAVLVFTENSTRVLEDVFGQFVTNGDVSSRLSIIEAILSIKEQLLADNLFALIKDKHPQVRSMAYEALGKFSSISEIGKLLIDGLHDKDPDVRWSAITILGEIGEKRHYHLLQEFLQDYTNTYRGKISEAAKFSIHKILEKSA